MRHEFQFYDVSDTLRCRFDYNVGFSGLCIDFFFEFWDFFKIWHVHVHINLRVERILRTMLTFVL